MRKKEKKNGDSGGKEKKKVKNKEEKENATAEYFINCLCQKKRSQVSLFSLSRDLLLCTWQKAECLQ